MLPQEAGIRNQPAFLDKCFWIVQLMNLKNIIFIQIPFKAGFSQLFNKKRVRKLFRFFSTLQLS